MRWKGEEQSENVEDRRSMRGPAAAVGGGMIVVVLIGMLLGIDPQKIQKLVDAERPIQQGAPESRELSPDEQGQKEFVATVLRFTEAVWEEQFQKAGEKYRRPHVVLFTEKVETGCGVAPSAVGPFYCPADQTVYLDPSFFNELQNKLGGSKAEFSQAYVLAHEVGHHVQKLLGYSAIVDEKRETLPKKEFNEWSVRLELQADYLAGVWAHYGQEKFNFIEPGDVETAITSANAIGDDRLQTRATGFTSPEKYTHGTSAQRVKWFKQGLNTGDLGRLKELFERPYDEL